MRSTCSALFYTQAGSPEAVLQLGSRPRLPLASEQIRVRVVAAGVNPAALLQVAGRYQMSIPYRFAPGFEAVGEVIEVGSAATFAVGQTVLGVMTSGAYASEVILNTAQSVVVHPRLVERTGVAALATMPVAYATAQLALNRRARVSDGGARHCHRNHRGGRLRGGAGGAKTGLPRNRLGTTRHVVRWTVAAWGGDGCARRRHQGERSGSSERRHHRYRGWRTRRGAHLAPDARGSSRHRWRGERASGPDSLSGVTGRRLGSPWRRLFIVRSAGT